MTSSSDWKLLSLTGVRPRWVIIVTMLLSFCSAIFIVSGKDHSLLDRILPQSFLEGEDMGYSCVLLTGIAMLLLTLLFFLSMRGFVRVMRNTNGAVKIRVTAPLTKEVIVDTVSRTEFYRSGAFRHVTIYAVFYDDKGNPALVLAEKTNTLHVVERHFIDRSPDVNAYVPKRFGSVNTLRQVWMEQQLP